MYNNYKNVQKIVTNIGLYSQIICRFFSFRSIDSFAFDFEQNMNVMLIFFSVDNIIVIIMISV